MLEERTCAYVLCDEVFPVTNERKIFCSDRCRGRHHALVNDEETEMIRLENNQIIANYRILKAFRDLNCDYWDTNWHIVQGTPLIAR